MVVPPPFEFDHVDYGVDQCQVCECLGEVPKVLPDLGILTFSVKIQCTREGQQLRAELAGALILADLAER